jgi:hypothetical protein
MTARRPPIENPMRRITVILPLLLALALPLVAAPARAEAKPMVGIGDQNFLMFQDARFQKLDLELTRLALPWDWYRDNPSYLTFLDHWVAAAREAKVRPLIAFTRNWRKNGDRYRVPRVLLRKSFKTFRKRYPDITDFSAWNEANHTTQPTAKSPRLAARYYKTLAAACPECTIVAADVLDTNDAPAWIKQFKRYAPKARLWGIHSYKDPNNGTTWHMRQLLSLVKGKVWLTETGGIKRLKPAPGSRGNGRFNTLRGQAKAIKRVYGLAKLFPRRIKRIYFYQWQQDPKARWDSAFLDHRGRVRPALGALRAGRR